MARYVRLVLLLSVCVGLPFVSTSTDVQAGNGNANQAIVAPHANYRGLSYGEWQALWWQAVLGTPVVDGDHPLFSGGAFAEHKGVVFLAAPFSDPNAEPVEIPITIRSGTALFFPIVNTECSEFEPDPFHGDDEAEMRACANALMDDTFDVFAFIDGKKVKKIGDYRTESPLFTWGPLPEDNLFAFFGLDAPAGTTSPAVDVGYYLLVKPLSIGEHVIEIGGTFGGILSGSINTRYVITVLPGRP